MSGLTELKVVLTLKEAKFISVAISNDLADAAGIHANRLASASNIITRAILAAEAKAKEPQCKCAMRHKEDGHMICGGFEPHAKYPDFCCATLSSGDVCAHDRACHSSAVEG